MLKGLKMKAYNEGYKKGFQTASDCGALAISNAYEKGKKDGAEKALRELEEEHDRNIKEYAKDFHCSEKEAEKQLERRPCQNFPQEANNEEPQTIPQILEAVKESICDKYCKWPGEFKNEEELWETMCAKCPLNRLS